MHPERQISFHCRVLAVVSGVKRQHTAFNTRHFCQNAAVKGPDGAVALAAALVGPAARPPFCHSPARCRAGRRRRRHNNPHPHPHPGALHTAGAEQPPALGKPHGTGTGTGTHGQEKTGRAGPGGLFLFHHSPNELGAAAPPPRRVTCGAGRAARPQHGGALDPSRCPRSSCPRPRCACAGAGPGPGGRRRGHGRGGAGRGPAGPCRIPRRGAGAGGRRGGPSSCVLQSRPHRTRGDNLGLPRCTSGMG